MGAILEDTPKVMDGAGAAAAGFPKGLGTEGVCEPNAGLLGAAAPNDGLGDAPKGALVLLVPNPVPVVVEKEGGAKGAGAGAPKTGCPNVFDPLPKPTDVLVA